MLLKFFKRGGTDDTRRTLGGSAVKTYLLGTDDKPRENARLLLGNPDDDTEIINGLTFAKVYTSGCLSFHEDEQITEDQKYDIIEDFEKMMFVGLEPHQYTSYWVEHTDKNRLELNFVFPNVELTSGKSLQVYYHFRDLNLVNAWKDLTNDKYNLINPSDLDKRRDVSPSIAPNIMKDWATSNKQSIIDKLKRFTEAEDIKAQLTDLVLTQSELRRQQGNPLTSQDDIADMLKDYGFEISRKGKDSISIKNPDPTKKNIKLKGVIYERTVNAASIHYIAQRSLQKGTSDPDIDTSLSEHEKQKCLKQSQITFITELEKRRKRHLQRYALNDEATNPIPPLCKEIRDTHHELTPSADNQSATYHRQLEQAVGRFAPENRPDIGSEESATTATAGPSPLTINTQLIHDAIESAAATRGRATQPPNPSLQPTNQPVYRRIKTATTVRNNRIGKRTRRISAIIREFAPDLDEIADSLLTERHRHQHGIEQVTEFADSHAERAESLNAVTRRIRKRKDGYANELRRVKTTTSELEFIASTVSAVVEAVIELFKQLYAGLKQQAYSYASQGGLSIRQIDTQQKRQVTQAEAKSYIDNHPYDLSGYQQLALTVQDWDRQKKNNDKTDEPTFRGFGM